MRNKNHLLYLLRHGEVEGPAAVYGRTDVPLSQKGWEQLQQQCQRLENLTQVVSSPLQRCYNFAERLCTERNLPLQKERDFQECDFGKWDGVPFDEVPQSNWGEMEAFWQSPATCQFEGGEALENMHKRVAAAWDRLLNDISAAETPENVLIIAHGGVIRLILAHILDLDWYNPALFSQWQIDYASLSKITLPNVKDTRAKVNYVAMPHNWKAE